MAKNKTLDLANIFQAVTSSLMENQASLNKADTNNHDHGDNMVEIFQVITQAMEEKHGADPADQLEYASQLLRRRKSGSAQMYAQGLAQASQQFQGQQVTPGNAMQLIQSLLGGGQAPPPMPAEPPAPDLLGSLLSGLTGGETQESQPQSGIDAGDLLMAGMAFMQSKQEGGSNIEALVDAVVASSQMGSTPHRAQSSALVTNTLMQVISAMSGN